MGDIKIFEDLMKQAFIKLERGAFFQPRQLGCLNFAHNQEFDCIECHFYKCMPMKETAIKQIQEAVTKASNAAGFKNPLFFFPTS